MRIFFAFFATMLKREIEYRGAMVVYFFSSLFHFGTALLVWLSAENQVFPGFSKAELIGYYVVLIAMDWFTNWSMFNTITQEIKDGDIQKDLLRPYSYLSLTLSKAAAFRIIASVLYFTGAAVIYGLFKHAGAPVSIPSIPWQNVPMFALAVVIAIAINFTFRFVLGLTAFWLTEVMFIDYAYYTIFPFLAGDVLPLSFLPPAVQHINSFLPFRYQLSFPMEILFGKVDPSQMWFGFAVGIAWWIFFYLVYKVMWKFGTRSYMAFGH